MYLTGTYTESDLPKLIERALRLRKLADQCTENSLPRLQEDLRAAAHEIDMQIQGLSSPLIDV